MGVTSTSKQINLERIDCDGTLQVTLALSASPDIVSFNQTATADTQLVTSVAARKDAADALDASAPFPRRCSSLTPSPQTPR